MFSVVLAFTHHFPNRVSVVTAQNRLRNTGAKKQPGGETIKCCVVFTRNRYIYPTSPVHLTPVVSVLFPNPREIPNVSGNILLWHRENTKQKQHSSIPYETMSVRHTTTACRRKLVSFYSGYLDLREGTLKC